MIVSEKSSANGLLIVITDSDLLGKKFEEGKVQLDLTKRFYQGEEKNEENIKKLISKARHVHFTGKESVELGKKLGLIEDKILVVQGVPHAEVLLD
jgi:hypothetical protein